MNSRQLSYFATVVEEGTISAAARKLHISQPPLSAQIRLLEEEYGVTLFERGARKITLTEAGEVLYKYAKEMLELEQAAGEDLHSLSIGQKGNVRLGLVSSADSELLYERIRTFEAEHPDIRFKITEANTYHLLEDMQKSKIELAVVRTPYNDSELNSIPLQTDTMVAIGQSCFMEQILEGEEMQIRNIGSLPLIIYRRWEKIIQKTVAEEKFDPNILCVCDDARTAIRWASAGIGVAIVPSSIVHYAPELLVRPLTEDAFRSSLCLVARKDARLTSSADLFYRSFEKDIESEV